MRRLTAHIGTVLAVAAMSAPPGQRQATARFRVPSVCAPAPAFRAVLAGSRIERATFFVQGRRHGSLTQPNAGQSWVATIATGSLKVGVHIVSARVVFTRVSGRRPITLSVGLRRYPSPQARLTG